MSTEPNRHAQKKLPTIFERLLLSHLLLLFVILLLGVWLYVYFFGGSLRYLHTRDPIVLVPFALGIIGVAGLISVWAARSIVVPIEKTTDSLSESSGFDFPRRIEEINTLIREIEQRNTRIANSTNDNAYANSVITDRENVREIVASYRQTISAVAQTIEQLESLAHESQAAQKIAELKEATIRLTINTSRLNTAIESQTTIRLL